MYYCLINNKRKYSVHGDVFRSSDKKKVLSFSCHVTLCGSEKTYVDVVCSMMRGFRLTGRIKSVLRDFLSDYGYSVGALYRQTSADNS